MGQDQSSFSENPMLLGNITKTGISQEELIFRQKQKQILEQAKQTLTRLSEKLEVSPSDIDGSLLIDTEFYMDLFLEPISKNTKNLFKPVRKAIRKTNGKIIFVNFNVFMQYNSFITYELNNFLDIETKQKRINVILHNLDIVIADLSDFIQGIF